MPWASLARARRRAARARDGDDGRERAAGDERRRDPRGEGRLVTGSAPSIQLPTISPLAAWPVRARRRRAGRAIPRSSAASRSRFRATTAAIRNSAPSGGTSPAGCATARPRLRRPGHVLSQPAGRRRGQREPLRAVAAPVRARGRSPIRARARLLHDQRAARAGFGLAEASADTTDVRIGDWSLRLAGDTYDARVAAREFALDARRSPRRGRRCCRATRA